jgi:hypothetical protein
MLLRHRAVRRLTHKTMKTYKITLPAYKLEITAEDIEEALEHFWSQFDYDHQTPNWGSPIIKEIKK